MNICWAGVILGHVDGDKGWSPVAPVLTLACGSLLYHGQPWLPDLLCVRMRIPTICPLWVPSMVQRPPPKGVHPAGALNKSAV